ncbi:MAG: thioredoxin fold domain-containing protein [Chitinophagales bacterium]|nr:thioredoxin fold domain-containing protein [Bacteroidota bacterium]
MNTLLKWSIVVVVLLCFLQPSSAQSHYYNGSVEQIALNARTQNKAYFITFSTQWCQPCKRMEQEVFSDPGIKNFSEKFYNSYKVDAELTQFNLLAMSHNVKAYPTVIFFDSSGKEILRLEGYTNRDKFLAILKQYAPAQNNRTITAFR